MMNNAKAILIRRKYLMLFSILCILTVILSNTVYAKTPSKKTVHKAYVKYIKKNYMPYYKTGKRKTVKTPYGSFTCEYIYLSAKETDINKDGINELIISSNTGAARGECSLFLYRNGKVVDTKIGGQGTPFVYKKKIFFPWTNGAADNGITRVSIKEKSKGIKSSDYEEIYDIKTGNATYKINDKVVSEEKYNKSLSLPSNYHSKDIEFDDIAKYIG